MIPSILTDTGGGTSARNSKPTQEAEAETTQTFGDVFGSAETEEAEAVQPLLGTADDSPELAFAMAEEPRGVKPPISPNVSAADGPPLLMQDKQVPVVAGQDIEPDQPAA
ncbi:MAG: hypothetical protein NWP79_00580, partial [Paracoccaceae bacterium]|nr:hypothetical protein [Paracoccaceae bacterium]